MAQKVRSLRFSCFSAVVAFALGNEQKDIYGLRLRG